MQITNIAILANPEAGNKKSIEFAQWLYQQLFIRQISSTVFSSNWPKLLADFSDVWIIGGDGTINYFINQYPDCKLPLALFKGGTGNDFACELYGKIKNQEIFERVLTALPKPVDAAQFNDKLYINCLGVGFDGEVLQSMDAIRLLGGHLGYVVAVVKTILKFTEPILSIKTNSYQANANFLLAMINNSPKAGGGFHISPGAKIDDGKLDIVLAKKLSIFKRLRYLPVIEKGKHFELPFIYHEQNTHFEIRSPMDLPIQMDGELLFAKDIIVDVLPEKFLFRY